MGHVQKIPKMSIVDFPGTDLLDLLRCKDDLMVFRVESSPARDTEHNISSASEVEPEVESREVTIGLTDCGSERNESVWSKLPDELLIPILARLPLQSIFKLRSVCKNWNSVLCDLNFLSTCSLVPYPAPFCFVVAIYGFAAYNPASANWNYCPYTCLLSNSLIRSFSPRGSITVAVAKSGILLLQDYESILFLTNPINKSYKRIPLVHEHCRCPTVVGMDVDRGTGAVKILLKCRHREPGWFMGYHEYDSKRASWEMVYDSKLGNVHKPFPRNYAVLHRGFWYYLTYEAIRSGTTYMLDEPHVIRLGGGVADEIQVPIPPSARLVHLFEWQGRLILIGATRDHVHECNWPMDSSLKSVHLWQLDLETENAQTQWVEILRMPTELLRAINFGATFSCVVDGNYICFSFRKPGVGHVPVPQAENMDMIMCNISKGSWWTVPCYHGEVLDTRFLLTPHSDIVLRQ